MWRREGMKKRMKRRKRMMIGFETYNRSSSLQNLKAVKKKQFG